MPQTPIKSLNSGPTRGTLSFKLPKCIAAHHIRNPLLTGILDHLGPGLLRNCKDKHKRYRTYLLQQQLATIRNKVTTLLRNAKSILVQSAATDTTHNARLHHIMKCLRQKSTTSIPDLHHPPPPPTHTHEATIAQEKTDMLNHFFIQQSEQFVTDSSATNPPIHTFPDIASTLHNITSPAEVESLLKQLNTEKIAGHGGIPTRLLILKEAAAELAPP